MTTLQVNGVYNFETYAPAILSGTYRSVKVLGMLSYTSAVREDDIIAKHLSVFPLLPPGTIEDCTKYTYVQVQSENGAKTILATEWIKQNTIELVTTRELTLKVVITETADVQRARNALIQNGFSQVTVVSTT